MKTSKQLFLLLFSIVVFSFTIKGNSQEKKLRPLTISYASVSGTRGPLWIAKDLKLFEKYGLDVNLIYIASGVTSVNALLGGSVQTIAASGSSVIGAAVRGAPVVIIASLGAIGLPGKDVKLIPTGLSESDRRIMIMLQGKIDATIGTVDNILQLELRGQRVSVLADFLEYGVYTTGSDIATSRALLKERPAGSQGVYHGHDRGNSDRPQ